MDSYADGENFDPANVRTEIAEWLKVNGKFTAMRGEEVNIPHTTTDFI